jgi:hypothetical protein
MIINRRKSSLLAWTLFALITALFSPHRHWVQAVIDRRFYRKKYDAQQVLAQFVKSARDEADLVALTADLLQGVQEMVQPVGMSIWLKK